MSSSPESQASTVFSRAIGAQRSGDLPAAESLYRQVLQLDPGHAGALHRLGVLALQANHLAEAVDWIRRAVERDASNPDIRADLGTALQAQGRVEEAIGQFREALRLQPDSWQLHYNLGNACKCQGDLDGAIDHYRAALRVKPDCVQAHANLGAALVQQGRFNAAVESFQRAVQLKPGLAIVRYNLARALHQQGRLDEALSCYREVIRRKPEFIDAYVELARVCRALGELDAAIAWLEQARRRKPNDGRVLRLLSGLLRDTGEFDAAIDCIQKIIEMNPQSAESYHNLGLTLEDQGKLDQAHACYRQALRRKPQFAPAAVAEAGILEKKGEFERAHEIIKPLVDAKDADVGATVLYAKLVRRFGQPQEAVARLEEVLRSRTLSAKWRIITHTTLGQVYDGLGRYDEAFVQFRQANELKPGRFDTRRHARMIDAIIHGFSVEQMARLPRVTERSEVPVFIVGMPRSGTSLVEQILASHPQIFGAGELTDIDRMATSLPRTLGVQTQFPACIGGLTREALDNLARTYLSRLRGFSSTARRVTDKMPYNHEHVGFIRLLFPTATIIHCVRDERDTCLSCYFSNFLASQTFTNDLRSLAHYHVQYQRLMRHWTQTLQLSLFEVRYEELVREPERVCRELLAQIGLGWDERCVRFNQSERFVNTASYQQVRQPIYTKSVGRWKNYEKHLGPLLDVLAQVHR